MGKLGIFLEYFEKSDCHGFPKGEMELTANSQVEFYSVDPGFSTAFLGNSFAFRIFRNGTTEPENELVVSVDSPGERKKWIQTIDANISYIKSQIEDDESGIRSIEVDFETNKSSTYHSIDMPTSVTNCVRINGFRGPKETFCNGTFEPTDEVAGNISVFRKRGGSQAIPEDSRSGEIVTIDVWIEYSLSTLSWQIKPTEYKGQNGTWAFVKCEPGTSLDRLGGRPWSVSNGVEFETQLPSIRICHEGGRGGAES